MEFFLQKPGGNWKFQVNKIMSYSAPYCMRHFSKIELNLTHFYTNLNLLLALWTDLYELFQKQLEVLKNDFLVKLCRKEIFGAWGPNISFPEGMGRCTYIWCHQKSYIHIIRYVGFYVYWWYWKYTQTYARQQAPRTTGGRKIWLSLKGGPF